MTTWSSCRMHMWWMACSSAAKSPNPWPLLVWIFCFSLSHPLPNAITGFDAHFSIPSKQWGVEETSTHPPPAAKRSHSASLRSILEPATDTTLPAKGLRSAGNAVSRRNLSATRCAPYHYHPSTTPCLAATLRPSAAAALTLCSEAVRRATAVSSPSCRSHRQRVCAIPYARLPHSLSIDSHHTVHN